MSFERKSGPASSSGWLYRAVPMSCRLSHVIAHQANLCHDEVTIVNEHELIEACRNGVREAQRELYEASGPRIYALLLRMTRNGDDAAELMQDTYIKVFKSITSFTGASRVETWIYQIALNEARQWLRRRDVYHDKLDRIRQDSDPMSSQADKDLELDVHEALEHLPEDEKTILILRHFEEMSYADIAEATGLPAGTVASRLNRARQRLQERLREHSVEKT